MTTNEQVTTEVLVVGQGFGGVETHLFLEKWGISDYQIIEKYDAPGGVWRVTTYPGARNDINPRQYSVGGKYIDTTAKRFPDGQSTRRYLEGFAKKHGLDRSRRRFNTRLYSLRFNDVTGEWTARTKSVEGDVDKTEGPTYIARFVILATGQLDKPFIPDIPGKDLFKGPMFHTARWEHHHDLEHKKVAVIGTGPSAAQVTAELAKIVGQLTVFQRSANWVIPRPPDEYSWLTRQLLSRSHIANRVLGFGGQLLTDLVLSPITSRGWSARPIELVASWQLRRQVPDPELRAQLTPNFPIGCKRPIISSTYYPAFMRENVELVTSKIREITEAGIITEDTVLHEADVIIYATGYETTNFYPGIDIRRGDVSLKEDIWKDGPEAYLGLAAEGMSNLFFVAGPGAFIGTGSNPTLKKMQLRLIGKAIKMARSWDGAGIEVLPDAMARFRNKRAGIIRKSVLLSCTSWQRDNEGRVVNTYGSSMWSFHRETRRDPRRDFGQVPLTGK